ncbi:MULTISPECIES: methyl-accepting chemotaxis protein [Dethiosulfovibrio]|uniref:Methyl-accepting chemotaxis protein n=2 Tax=Dethiosulfovibrio TaxID=47054 RepID=A0ABS9ESP0_9BACT|nr:MULTISPECIES: methyl-accepting chemotaxis protein [Dethiosulfovibrio]MCF4114854.1 methyl-accepting chemotaxis protein [Dethiosulfovibrio russensis]MCF4143251.1 methyl-accepting chemotaxis protein [Dethiosulfovibrio marinus]MCF4145359.1 methyl-accepting chemotaxis protein [Dethiosulfovibrio acidaminovorans]
MRRWGLKTKLLVVILSVSFVAFTTAVGVLTYRARTMALGNAYSLGEETAQRYGVQVSEYLGRALTHARDLSVQFSMMVDRERSDRDAGVDLLRTTLESNPQLFGAWAVFEPNVFDGRDSEFVGSEGHDDTGRYIPYLVRSGGDILHDPCVGYETAEYYQLPLTSGKVVIADPAEWEVGGKMVMMTSLCVPVKLGGKVIGVVGVDISMDTFQKVFSEIKPFVTGYAGLLSDKGTYVAYPKKDLVGTTVSDGEALSAIRDGKNFNRSVVSDVSGVDIYETFQPVDVDRYGSPWSVQIALPYDMIYQEADSIMTMGIMVGVAALAVLAGVVLFFVSRMVRPIKAASLLASRAKDGDLTITRDEFQTSSGDEVGRMADSLSEMVEGLRDIVGSVVEEAQSVSDRSTSLAALSEEANASMEEIRSSVEKVASLAESNSAALQESGASVQEVADSAQMSASSATEGAEASQRSAEETQKAVGKVEETIHKMEEAGEVSRESIGRIRDLAGSVDSISGFVGDITRIADQTNLLALNAAIEAARAGEAGRGFAVVAEEVRKLAEESALSADKVAKIIVELEEHSGESIDATERTGSILSEAVESAKGAQEELNRSLEMTREVNEAIQNIAAVAQEQAASSEEMTSSIDQVTNANFDTVRMMEAIRGASEETAKASEGVSLEAQAMAEGASSMMSLVKRFKLKKEGRGLARL